MMGTISFKLPEETTLKVQKEIIDRLSKNDEYMVGGDDGLIQYFLGGEVTLYDWEDEDVPRVIGIIDGAGMWPEFESCSCGEYDHLYPPEDMCRSRLATNGNDYRDLWEWMKECADKGWEK